MSLRSRWEGRFWEQSLLWRRPLRRLKGWLARRAADRHGATIVESAPFTDPATTLEPPILAEVRGAGTYPTEHHGSKEAHYLLLGDDEASPAACPATHDLALMAAVAEDLAIVEHVAQTPVAPRPPTLVRTPHGDRLDAPAVLGRQLPWPGVDLPARALRTQPPGYLVHPQRRATRHRTPRHEIDRTLAREPVSAEVPTLLFLLPYLAVGGAERQLLDLLRHLAGRARCLVVTLEPHQPARGDCLAATRALTPFVYPLGETLPRAGHLGALRHLLRRYAVHTLVSWNGTVDFYDHLRTLGAARDGLRLVHQLYNHEGGWLARTGPRATARLDLHLAINGRIRDALVARGVPASKIEVVYPAAARVPEANDEAKTRARRAKREELGIAEDAFVAGSFVRLHAQKRPLDLVALARRLPDVTFLLAGDGPAAPDLDAALAARPAPNVLRLGMRDDVETLYDALDLCLITSDYEGLPVFLLDGLARGIPCVATAVGDIPLLLEDGGGVLVDRPGDLDALTAGIQRLRDPALRRAEGARGRRTVARRFDLADQVRRYETLLLGEAAPQTASSATTGARAEQAMPETPAAPPPPPPRHGTPKPPDRDTAPLDASVIIPSYNHARYVLTAVDSALAQDVREVVVVDDGSRDDSLARLATRDDPRLRVVSQPNRGAHHALNRALAMARGDVVMILNSDDTFAPDRVARLLACFARDPDCAVAVSWLRVIDDAGTPLGVKEAWRNMPPWAPRGKPTLADTGDPLLALLEANYVATTSNVAVRRDVVRRAGLTFGPLRYAHDWDFLFGACRLGTFALEEAPLVDYRVHAENTLKETAAGASNETPDPPGAHEQDTGVGAMRFEALWVMARHATWVLDAAASTREERDALTRRFWRSLPPFAPDVLVAQLVHLRGTSQEPPPRYERLLDPGHPFRRAAIAQLAALPTT